MDTVELQKLVFMAPSRSKLSNFIPTLEKKYKIQVFRNHSFELVEHTIHPYLEYAQLGVSFIYSGYDDSFSFTELDAASDALIIWVDSERYSVENDFPEFIRNRVTALRKVYTKPVLIVPYGAELTFEILGGWIFNLTDIKRRLKEKFTDIRVKEITGTSLSREAMLAISKELGLHYIPSMLRPSLKAVAIDFDNTLYQGVLGEDGIDGVVLTEGHNELQKYLKQLSKKGILLCAVSKNEYADVIQLLEKRADFPLERGDFTKLCVSWKSKAESIQEIADYLNIGIDSILFVDDNIGELKAVTMAYPQIRILHAEEKGEETCNALKEYPGLFPSNADSVSQLRSSDIQANEMRRKISINAASKEDYIRSLNIVLIYDINNTAQEKRIVELANKTNQFIFNFMRYTEADMAMRLQSPEYAVVTVSLKDCLADSGLVAVCVGHRMEGFVELEECFMSCRALGRGIEGVIILEGIRLVLDQLHEKNIRIDFTEGPRNAPAYRFAQEMLSNYIGVTSAFEYTAPRNLIEIKYNN